METVVANAVGKVRRALMGGKAYLVAPVRMIVPGVLNGSEGPIYYPADENEKSASAWNGMPIVVYHPYREGKPVSARRPDVLDAQGIGVVLHSRTEKGVLKAEGWFDVEATRRVDERVIDALEAGQKIELSTGLFLDEEPAPIGAEHKGKSYVSIARNYRPDHLAVLPDLVGACSIQDGCGVLVNTTWISPSSWVEQPEVWEPEEGSMTLVTNAEYDQSLGDKMSLLSGQLSERFGHEAWLSDVYENYLVYSREGKFYRLDINHEDGYCELSDEKPVEVRRVTVYEPTNNTKREEWIMALNPQQKTALIDELVANCDCWKHPGDKDILNNFSDDKLLQLKEAFVKEQQAITVANTAVKGFTDGNGNAYRINPSSGKWEQQVVNAKKTNDTGTAAADEDEEEEYEPPMPKKKKKAMNAAAPEPKPKKPATTDEWFRQAPVEVQNMYQAAKSIEQREKDKIISELLVNVNEADKPVHRERLYKRSLEDLANDRALIPAAVKQDDIDKANNRPAGNRKARVVPEDHDMLHMPTINWDDDKSSEPTRLPTVQPVSSVVENSDYGNEEEWLKSAPRAIQAMVQNAQVVEAREKRKLIDQLTGHIADDEQQQRVINTLNTKSVKELQDLLILAPRQDTPKPNYFGSSTPPAANTRVSDVNEDVLPLPTMNWTGDNGGKRKQG